MKKILDSVLEFGGLIRWTLERFDRRKREQDSKKKGKTLRGIGRYFGKYHDE